MLLSHNLGGLVGMRHRLGGAGGGGTPGLDPSIDSIFAIEPLGRSVAWSRGYELRNIISITDSGGGGGGLARLEVNSGFTDLSEGKIIRLIGSDEYDGDHAIAMIVDVNIVDLDTPYIGDDGEAGTARYMGEVVTGDDCGAIDNVDGALAVATDDSDRPLLDADGIRFNFFRYRIYPAPISLPSLFSMILVVNRTEDANGFIFSDTGTSVVHIDIDGTMTVIDGSGSVGITTTAFVGQDWNNLISINKADFVTTDIKIGSDVPLQTDAIDVENALHFDFMGSVSSDFYRLRAAYVYGTALTSEQIDQIGLWLKAQAWCGVGFEP